MQLVEFDRSAQCIFARKPRFDYALACTRGVNQHHRYILHAATRVECAVARGCGTRSPITCHDGERERAFAHRGSGDVAVVDVVARGRQYSRHAEQYVEHSSHDVCAVLEDYVFRVGVHNVPIGSYDFDVGRVGLHRNQIRIHLARFPCVGDSFARRGQGHCCGNLVLA